VGAAAVAVDGGRAGCGPSLGAPPPAPLALLSGLCFFSNVALVHVGRLFACALFLRLEKVRVGGTLAEKVGVRDVFFCRFSFPPQTAIAPLPASGLLLTASSTRQYGDLVRSLDSTFALMHHGCTNVHAIELLHREKLQ